MPRTTRGGQRVYSSLAITTALTLRAVFGLPLRQTEGLIGSILKLLGLDLAVPDHTTLSRRAETLKVAGPRSGTHPLHLLVDSTGLRLCGPGEWLVEKHGSKKRRSWRKLHLGVDADIGQIVAAKLTKSEVDDGSQVAPLLDQIDAPVARFTADGAYDRDGVYSELTARYPEAAVIVPPRSNAIPSQTASTAPTQRDRHLQLIAEHGRTGWQRLSGYNSRALVEADIGRYKRVIGDALGARTEARRATEIKIAVLVLNRMLELAARMIAAPPKYKSRVALTRLSLIHATQSCASTTALSAMPHDYRREQAPRSCPRPSQGKAGHGAHNEGEDQQRE